MAWHGLIDTNILLLNVHALSYSPPTYLSFCVHVPFRQRMVAAVAVAHSRGWWWSAMKVYLKEINKGKLKWRKESTYLASLPMPYPFTLYLHLFYMHLHSFALANLSGEKGQHIRLQLQLQIREGMTYLLQGERESNMSVCSNNYKWRQGWHTSWRQRGGASISKSEVGRQCWTELDRATESTAKPLFNRIRQFRLNLERTLQNSRVPCNICRALHSPIYMPAFWPFCLALLVAI